MVHFYRNVFSHVPAGKLREVALMLKAIHAQEDLAAAQRKAGEVVARLHSMRLGKAAELRDDILTLLKKKQEWDGPAGDLSRREPGRMGGRQAVWHCRR